MTLMRDLVLVRRISVTEKTSGSIVIPDTAIIEDLDKPRLGVVLEVGPDVREVRNLDRVMIEPGKGMELEWQPDNGDLFDDEIWDCVIVPESTIMAVLNQLDPEQVGLGRADVGPNIEARSDWEYGRYVPA